MLPFSFSIFGWEHPVSNTDDRRGEIKKLKDFVKHVSWVSF